MRFQVLQWQVWRWLASGLSYYVVLQKFINVSVVLTVPFTKAMMVASEWERKVKVRNKGGGDNNVNIAKLQWVNSLYSPLHIQDILRWHAAPILLKSHAAQVVSSTIADGCKRFVRIMFGYIAPETIILSILSALLIPQNTDWLNLFLDYLIMLIIKCLTYVTHLIFITWYVHFPTLPVK